MWKNVSKILWGEDNFFAQYRGDNFVVHNLIHKGFHVEIFLGGGKKENVLKNQRGGGKNGCGQGSKWGGIKFWEFFRGGIKICPRHVHNALTRMCCPLLLVDAVRAFKFEKDQFVFVFRGCQAAI